MPRFKLNRFGAASRGLAGVLAAVLLLCELLASNGRFHQSLHQGGNTASNSCLLCLFAKGHMDTTEPAPASYLPAQSAFESAAPTETVALVDFRYLLSPSRAPPAFASLPSVVA